MKGKETGDDITSWKWPRKFKFGDNDIEDNPRLGRPWTIDDVDQYQAVDDNPNTTTWHSQWLTDDRRQLKLMDCIVQRVASLYVISIALKRVSITGRGCVYY